MTQSAAEGLFAARRSPQAQLERLA